MTRTRLTASAFLFLAVLPGCGLFDRDREPRCPRLHALFCGRQEENNMAAYPVVAGGAECSTCAPGMPMSGPITSGPMIMQPGPGAGGMNPTIPPANTMPPKIPSPGIRESEGKQFELEGASKIGPGPVLAVPAGGSKMR
jgi:hypothetical protein